MAHKSNSKVIKAIAEGMEAVGAFQKMLCTAPDGCEGGVVAVIVHLVGENQVAVGGYCFTHIGLLSIYQSMKPAEEDSSEGSD